MVTVFKLFKESDYPFQAIKTAPRVFEKETRSWLWKSVFMFQSAVKKRTPVGAGPGHLQDSVMAGVRGETANLRGEVYTSKLHGAAVEDGTKPHMPPYYPIFYWVTRKLGISIITGQARKVTRAIQWKIFHHGTKGAHMFKKGWKDVDLKVTAGFYQAADKIRAHLEGK